MGKKITEDMLEEEATIEVAPNVVAVKEESVQDFFINAPKTEQQRALVSKLLKEPRKDVLVERVPGESPDATFEGAINGMVYIFKKGRYYSLPETIAKLMKDSQGQTEVAVSNMKLDRNNDVRDALL